jgi:hypothetical protein
VMLAALKNMADMPDNNMNCPSFAPS